MTTTLFISDLHLSEERPQITALLLDFLRTRASNADALYILGDLFEVWLGDDVILPAYHTVIGALRELSASGVATYIMHGNRDFLLGEAFCQQSGCQLLPDPTIIELNGERTLLMHGDTLCTDDLEYQQFRSDVRNPEAQRQFLAMPLEKRIEVATLYRTESRKRSRNKTEEIMDVNQQAVIDAMQNHNVHQMIHGHTHRPAIHDVPLNDRKGRRIVLGDWYHQGSLLSCDAHGCHLEVLGQDL